MLTLLKSNGYVMRRQVMDYVEEFRDGHGTRLRSHQPFSPPFAAAVASV